MSMLFIPPDTQLTIKAWRTQGSTRMNCYMILIPPALAAEFFGRESMHSFEDFGKMVGIFKAETNSYVLHQQGGQYEQRRCRKSALPRPSVARSGRLA